MVNRMMERLVWNNFAGANSETARLHSLRVRLGWMPDGIPERALRRRLRRVREAHFAMVNPVMERLVSEQLCRGEFGDGPVAQLARQTWLDAGRNPPKVRFAGGWGVSAGRISRC